MPETIYNMRSLGALVGGMLGPSFRTSEDAWRWSCFSCSFRANLRVARPGSFPQIHIEAHQVYRDMYIICPVCVFIHIHIDKGLLQGRFRVHRRKACGCDTEVHYLDDELT